MRILTLKDGAAETVVVPALGGGLASYDLLLGERREPLFRRCAKPKRAAPFDLALNVLVPWSGRISGGGFRFGGRFHALSPNLVGEGLPIHGNGFSSRWTVIAANSNCATLALRSRGPGPYDYAATVTYALRGGALAIDLAVTHRGLDPLPYGLGLHPWFPRTPGTRLHAPAATVTLEDSRHLPAGTLPVTSRPDWDFNAPRGLPGTWINNDFSPWNGTAVIAWEDRDLALDVDVSEDPHLRSFILHSPASDADFFCFEPVTHLVDAHNRHGGPDANGLVVLGPKETLRVACAFTPRQICAPRKN